MAKMDIRAITSFQIEQFMSQAIQEYDLTARKALENYRMFFEFVYRQAVVDRVVKPDENPSVHISSKIDSSSSEGSESDRKKNRGLSILTQ